MCREKYAVKHDDRLDCLAQGVKYYTDALAISAQTQIQLRKEEEWNDLLEDYLTNPTASANHLVMGMDLEQRRKARGIETGTQSTTWI